MPAPSPRGNDPDLGVLFEREGVTRRVTSRLISIEDLLGPRQRMYVCPFHMDTEPSAKIYKDKDGVTRLFCYGCRKQFTSFDHLKIVQGLNPAEHLVKTFPREALILAIRAAREAQVVSFVEVERVRTLTNTYLKDGKVSELFDALYVPEREPDA